MPITLRKHIPATTARRLSPLSRARPFVDFSTRNILCSHRGGAWRGALARAREQSTVAKLPGDGILCVCMYAGDGAAKVVGVRCVRCTPCVALCVCMPCPCNIIFESDSWCNLLGACVWRLPAARTLLCTLSLSTTYIQYSVCVHTHTHTLRPKVLAQLRLSSIMNLL